MRAALVASLLFVMSLPLAAIQALICRIARPVWWVIPMWWHRTACRLMGIRIEVRGEPITDEAALFVCNHISWLDINVLGGRVRGSFIAKQEVAGWGVFGALARLHRTVFVDRTRRSASVGQRDEMRDRLCEGDSLILFAEGTSTDGTWVKPFKSALFSVAEAREGDREPRVQPVTISYTHVNGMPFVRAQRPRIAWFGDMELGGHVLHVMGMGQITAVLQFHEPMRLSEMGSRKALANASHAAVSQGLVAANAGRLDAREPARHVTTAAA